MAASVNVTYRRSLRLRDLLNHDLWLSLIRGLGCHWRRRCRRTGHRDSTCHRQLLDRCWWGLYSQVYFCWAQHTLLPCCCLSYITLIYYVLNNTECLKNPSQRQIVHCKINERWPHVSRHKYYQLQQK